MDNISRNMDEIGRIVEVQDIEPISSDAGSLSSPSQPDLLEDDVHVYKLEKQHLAPDQ